MLRFALLMGVYSLEVFVVPHSHCDTGWVKTFDSYYEDKVSSILTNVVGLLQENSERRFAWAEM
jgi:alpha-mannosidase II